MSGNKISLQYLCYALCSVTSSNESLLQSTLLYYQEFVVVNVKPHRTIWHLKFPSQTGTSSRETESVIGTAATEMESQLPLGRKHIFSNNFLFPSSFLRFVKWKINFGDAYKVNLTEFQMWVLSMFKPRELSQL
jgi:hypothetical protein